MSFLIFLALVAIAIPLWGIESVLASWFNETFCKEQMAKDRATRQAKEGEKA